jgi:hypothetical protein
MEPKLKPHGTNRLKVTCDILLSTSAFKFNLRRYSLDLTDAGSIAEVQEFITREYGRLDCLVGRCRLTPSNAR